MKNTNLRPFIKWAGGKGQLLAEIRCRYPHNKDNSIKRYCEPFIGGGAVLFDILSQYNFDSIYISDTNKELINTYVMIRDDVCGIVDVLKQLQNDFLSKDIEARKKYYYQRRGEFNKLKANDNIKDNLRKASLFIFLNRTCFNGLFRVNSKGLFNVPMGAYKNPLICDEVNLRNVSRSLCNVKIHHGDYRDSLGFIDNSTFVYIDPPYRPLTTTASFRAYNEIPFNDKEQIELAEYITKLNKLGAKVVASNSDPKNIDSEDDFFDKLYEAFQINRVAAKRRISCNSKSRGHISELLICN